MTTLNRLLESVFEGKRFESIHNSIPTEKVEKAIKEIPFTLSSAQKSSIYQAFTNDVTYIQGPPGTGKSYTISALAILASKLGLKTLVASQKKPAVEIVYSKVSNLLGEEGCLFLTDNNDRKEIIGKSKFIFFILLFYSILFILLTVDLTQLVNKSKIF